VDGFLGKWAHFFADDAVDVIRPSIVTMPDIGLISTLLNIDII
jgi:hypothetical protein